MKYFITLLPLVWSVLLPAQGEALFSDAELHEIRIENADTTFDLSDREYQQVDIIIDGERLDSVAIRLKGNISATHTNRKVPLKVKTNKFVRGKKIDGIKEFTLHNQYQDPSMLREKITYDLMGELGLHSLRAAFARVYINDVYWGLYTLLEAKDELYDRAFDNDDAAVLESFEGGNMCYAGPNRADYTHELFGDSYIIDNGEADTAWAYFPAMLDAANNTPAADYMDIVPGFLNVTDWFTYQAANVYLVNPDSYLAFEGNQLYYFNEMSRIWEVIPWDFNASLGLWNTNNYGPGDLALVPEAMNGCIARRMGEVPELMDIYNGAICNLINELADTTRMVTRIDALRGQIEQAVYDDGRKEFTNADFDRATEYGYFESRTESSFEENVPALKTFFIDRANFIRTELATANVDCIALPTYEPFAEGQLSVSPNPAFDEVFVSLTEPGDDLDRVELYDCAGRLLISQAGRNSPKAELSLVNLPAGLYVVRVHSGSGKVGVRKLVKR